MKSAGSTWHDAAVRSFSLPRGSFRAEAAVPGDKSLSHRALLLAAMASGESRITHLGPGDDVAATIRALQALGVGIADGAVRSPGVGAWAPPPGPIDAANSATTMRLLAGALAARPFSTTLIGDASLMARPMGRLVAPLAALGARVDLAPEGRPPVIVVGGRLHGADLSIPQPSAQVRTSAALAALQAEGRSVIDSPAGFRDHTERWLEDAGLGRRLSETRFEVLPGEVRPGRYDLPGDLSAASFLFAAAALRPGAEVTVRGVTLNPGRTGFLDILEAMGAQVARALTGRCRGDPVGEVTVKGADLHGLVVTGMLALRALDELPLVAVLGAAATGETAVGGAPELRVKESDRVAAAVGMVRALGGSAEERADGFVVGGGLRGGRVHAGGDHRIAMAAAVAAVATRGEVAVDGYEAVRVSWPDFGEALEALWS
jgi:3-phosphoshikimate 1-carboxyvinyltransferase